MHAGLVVLVRSLFSLVLWSVAPGRAAPFEGRFDDGAPVDGAAARLSYGAVELRWTAPDGCPDADALDARVRADLVNEPDPGEPLSILIDDVVTAAQDGRFVLVSHTTSATGSEQRRWVADTCDTLAEIAIAQASSAIDQSLMEPLVPLDRNAQTRTSEPPPLPAIAPELDVAVASRPPPRRSKRLAIDLRPMVGLELGGLPGAGPVVGLAAAGVLRRIRSEIGVKYFAPRYTNGVEGAGAVMQLLAVDARVCTRATWRRLEIAAPCVGLELGATLGRGVGVDNPKRDTVLWAAALLGPALAVRVASRVHAFGEAHAAFPLGHPVFAMRELGTVWRASTGLRLLVGLEIRLR